MSDIKKGSVVWYFDSIIHEWRKGKVLAVNKYGLTIKKRHNHYSGWLASHDGLVITADQPKPVCLPYELERKRRIEANHDYWYKTYGIHHSAYILLQRHGLMP